MGKAGEEKHRKTKGSALSGWEELHRDCRERDPGFSFPGLLEKQPMERLYALSYKGLDTFNKFDI